MSLCFQSFNYQHVKNCVNKRTTQSHGKKNSISPVKLPSLIIKQGERNDHYPPEPRPISSDNDCNCSPFTAQSNCIGIIGGVSVESGLSFAKKLVNFEDIEEKYSPPPFMLSCDPLLSEELSSLKREFFSRRNGMIRSFDHSSIVEKIKGRRTSLEKSGVCCLAMPCHLLHSWYDEIEQGSCVHFLHVGDCVAKELKEAKLRPIEAGSPIRIGVLATNENLVARFYQEKLENEGFEVILPDKATVEHMVIPAVEALNRKDVDGAQNLFRIALQVLLVRAVNRVILASDDFRQLLPPNDPLWTKCIDPMDGLARSCLKFAQSVGNR
ncbi:aspartate-glutamate racemase family [Striga hermonthica]|uniref:Aspartate-glutamate racemase family n=1 Tax=Striga hermonthica TaxID=68872 RepID=A0A9N7RP94_STRHE|nr:aspartate-glutamate racemase family [Striga hermonthica]